MYNSVVVFVCGCVAALRHEKVVVFGGGDERLFIGKRRDGGDGACLVVDRVYRVSGPEVGGAEDEGNKDDECKEWFQYWDVSIIRSMLRLAVPATEGESFRIRYICDFSLEGDGFVWHD